MKKVVIVLGPTASGKTKFSIDLAKELNGAIISADSMQVYKYMNIGTAKPSKEEQKGIPHYLLDEVLPSKEFSVAKFRDLSIEYINQIFEDSKMPIIVGGTGLYISVLLQNIEFSQTSMNWELRQELQDLARLQGNEVLWTMLNKFDPVTSSRIHMNDTKRIIRAIEIFQQTGKTMTEHLKQSRKKPLPYTFIPIGLHWPRELLYQRINQRVDMMIEEGLENEVKTLIEMNFGNCKIPMQAIGYKELLLYFNNQLTFEEAIEKLKRDTRRFAKRQMTWFRKMEDVFWVDMNEQEDHGVLIKKIQQYIERYHKIK